MRRDQYCNKNLLQINIEMENIHQAEQPKKRRGWRGGHRRHQSEGKDDFQE